jgi:hypothetical protein
MSEQQQQPPPPHTSSQYNAQVIIDNATTQLNNSSTGGVQSAQTTFQSALLDWVDDVTMGDTMETEEAQRVRGEIVKLWLAYAHFNKNSKLVSIRLVHAYG